MARQQTITVSFNKQGRPVSRSVAPAGTSPKVTEARERRKRLASAGATSQLTSKELENLETTGRTGSRTAAGPTSQLTPKELESLRTTGRTGSRTKFQQMVEDPFQTSKPVLGEEKVSTSRTVSDGKVPDVFEARRSFLTERERLSTSPASRQLAETGEVITPEEAEKRRDIIVARQKQLAEAGKILSEEDEQANAQARIDVLSRTSEKEFAQIEQQAIGSKKFTTEIQEVEDEEGNVVQQKVFVPTKRATQKDVDKLNAQLSSYQERSGERFALQEKIVSESQTRAEQISQSQKEQRQLALESNEFNLDVEAANKAANVFSQPQTFTSVGQASVPVLQKSPENVKSVLLDNFFTPSPKQAQRRAEIITGAIVGSAVFKEASKLNTRLAGVTQRIFPSDQAVRNLFAEGKVDTKILKPSFSNLRGTTREVVQLDVGKFRRSIFASISLPLYLAETLGGVKGKSFAQGVGLGGIQTIRDRPLLVAGVTALSFGLGAVGSVAVKSGLGLATAFKGSSIGLGVVGTGLTGYGIATSPTYEGKGRILGTTGVLAFAGTVGAGLGSRFGNFFVQQRLSPRGFRVSAKGETLRFQSTRQVDRLKIKTVWKQRNTVFGKFKRKQLTLNFDQIGGYKGKEGGQVFRGVGKAKGLQLNLRSFAEPSKGSLKQTSVFDITKGKTTQTFELTSKTTLIDEPRVTGEVFRGERIQIIQPKPKGVKEFVVESKLIGPDGKVTKFVDLGKTEFYKEVPGLYVQEKISLKGRLRGSLLTTKAPKVSTTAKLISRIKAGQIFQVTQPTGRQGLIPSLKDVLPRGFGTSVQQQVGIFPKTTVPSGSLNSQALGFGIGRAIIPTVNVQPNLVGVGSGLGFAGILGPTKEDFKTNFKGFIKGPPKIAVLNKPNIGVKPNVIPSVGVLPSVGVGTGTNVGIKNQSVIQQVSSPAPVTPPTIPSYGPVVGLGGFFGLPGPGGVQQRPRRGGRGSKKKKPGKFVQTLFGIVKGARLTGKRRVFTGFELIR